MYFGERALLNHARRAASIIATSVNLKLKNKNKPFQILYFNLFFFLNKLFNKFHF